MRKCNPVGWCIMLRILLTEHSKNDKIRSKTNMESNTLDWLGVSWLQTNSDNATHTKQWHKVKCWWAYGFKPKPDEQLSVNTHLRHLQTSKEAFNLHGLTNLTGWVFCGLWCSFLFFMPAFCICGWSWVLSRASVYNLGIPELAKSTEVFYGFMVWVYTEDAWWLKNILEKQQRG